MFLPCEASCEHVSHIFDSWRAAAECLAGWLAGFRVEEVRGQLANTAVVLSAMAAGPLADVLSYVEAHAFVEALRDAVLDAQQRMRQAQVRPHPPTHPSLPHALPRTPLPARLPARQSLD
jgi:hypothetical protein